MLRPKPKFALVALSSWYTIWLTKALVWIPFHGGFASHNLPRHFLHAAQEATIMLVAWLACIALVYGLLEWFVAIDYYVTGEPQTTED